MILTYSIESYRGAVMEVVAAQAQRNYRVEMTNISTAIWVMRPVTTGKISKLSDRK